MFNNFVVAVEAVIPLFCLMFIGNLIRRLNLMSPDELKHMNKMVFTIFFAIMMFYNLYKADFSQSIQPDLMAFCFLGVLLVCIISAIPICLAIKENPTRGTMIHAIFRSNFVIMGIPMVANIFGPDQIGVTTVLIAVIVPLYNVLGVLVLETFRGGKFNLLKILKGVLKNPMIVGAIVGLTFNLLNIYVPSPILKPLAQVSAATTPVALMILGASFTWSGVTEKIAPLAATLIARLIIVPAIILPLAYYLGFRGIEFVTIISIYCTPCAVASFAMAQQMKGDAALAGNCVVFSSAFSCFTLFAWIFITKTLGIF